MKVRILGIGNPILKDDAIGIEVAKYLECKNIVGVEIREVESGGMDLLEEFRGCDIAIVVDSIVTCNHEPGSIIEMTLNELPFTRRLRGAHDADLNSALHLAKAIGMDLPEKVSVLAIEVSDNSTFGYGMTPEVEKAVVSAAEKALSLAFAELKKVSDQDWR